jgi:thioesterase domain-containing protein/acyl carrier protein
MSHRSLANLVFAAAKRPGVNHRDIVVHASPLSSGQAVFEAFLPLLNGARLVMPLEAELANGRSLLHLLQRSSATVLYGPAALWWDLLNANWIGYPALKMLCPANELTPRLIERLAATGGELWSLTGWAEAGQWSAVRLVKPGEPLGLIGEPIANTTLMVLEPSLRTAPVGVVGQLYTGGDGLSERALSASVVAESGLRMYPTGCLARLKSSGGIEILGRLDERFWSAGMLIDPREIEYALLRTPDVAEAVVVPIRDERDLCVALAFVTPRGGADPAALSAALEQSLAASLPAPLRPTAIMVRESLPRLHDGSIDRLLLKSAKARANRVASRATAGSDIENRLAGIWSSMLGVKGLAPTDNFFELGGHSLLAARMLTQVEREFGKRIKLATLFLAPTLGEFAAILSQAETREFDFRQVVKIQPHGSKRPLIAINNTGIYYSLAKGLGAERPVYSLQLFDPSVRDTALPETLEEIAAGYVGLIRRVQPQGPYELMGWCVAGALAFEVARQLTAQGDQVAHLFLIDSWVPGYFQRLPALRRVIGLYSLRAQLIIADWRRVVSSEKSIGDFIRHRTVYKRLMRLLRADGDKPAVASSELSTPETYDAWLLAYLQRVTAKYTPKMFDGAVTLLRSRLEPTGWFFDQDAGWSSFSRSGAKVLFVDGNHFTMFQEPGARQMAEHVAATLEDRADGVTRGVAPAP